MHIMTKTKLSELYYYVAPLLDGYCYDPEVVPPELCQVSYSYSCNYREH